MVHGGILPFLPPGIAAVCAWGSCLAQPPVRHGADTTLAGQVDLARLVDLAADRLKLSVSYDPQALRSTVTIRAASSLTDDELWSLANQSLFFQGWTTVRAPSGVAGGADRSGSAKGSSAPADTTFSIVKIADAAQSARIEPLRDIGASLLDRPVSGYATVLLRPRHANAKDLVETAKVVLTGAGSR